MSGIYQIQLPLILFTKKFQYNQKVKSFDLHVIVLNLLAVNTFFQVEH
jgi:hypothetical protein